MKIHLRNLQELLIELVIVNISVARKNVEEISDMNFLVKHHNFRSVQYETETASFITLNLWNIIPEGWKKYDFFYSEN